MKNLPVYKHPASYAREHDELAAYRASNQANTACKEAIETAIRDHYRDRDLTEKEEAKLAKERDALTALCEKEAAKCSS